MMMLCAMLSTGGCVKAVDHADARFKDVQRKPPLSRAATVDYLIANDRPLAVWIEETAKACDDYGCL